MDVFDLIKANTGDLSEEHLYSCYDIVRHIPDGTYKDKCKNYLWEEFKDLRKDKVIIDENVAVLISPNYGSGWSTSNDLDRFPNLVYEPFLVRILMDGVDSVDALDAFKRVTLRDGGEHLYIGCGDLAIEWIPWGQRFSIQQFDGHEYIVTNLATESQD